MKKILCLAVIGVTLSCQSQKKEFSSAALQNKLTALDGAQIAFKDILAEHRGKTVVLEIWASWCGDCVKAMPKLKELQQNHPEADYVFVSMDKADDKWKAGIEKHQLKGSHYWATDGMKGAFGKSIDLDWIPRYIVIDPTGKVVLYRAIETDFEKIDATLNSLKP
ncbi:TlpA family protein disulfide reductase [Flavobacterium caeni]|uniref:Thiol-disulfide isomerase or thioredoxin n=1 Tax=Flavobacterium caeni TaxID=490189 RepID=A0A1G5BBL5_9FLAO|nr:TlpA disulfide reductase family protein [Flavobacterium caeni]SCX87516.1 Thiol-disulfide isomerase or thioredoxin [Flavobacterium caeni]